MTDNEHAIAPNPFAGLRVAITGGTSGLGLALVRELLNRWAQVAFVARRREGVERVVRVVRTHTALSVTCRGRKTFIRSRCRSWVRSAALTFSSTTHRIWGRRLLPCWQIPNVKTLSARCATNVLGPFRLTKALLGSLAASAREGRGAVVLNVSSDAAINAYPRWGAYGASKAALHHLSRIWNEELTAEGIRFLSIDPGDMDTPLHAAAVPDADRSTLKRPEVAARELADAIASVLPAARRNRDFGSEGGGWVKAANLPIQRPANAKLLIVDRRRMIAHRPRSDFADLLHAGIS